MDHPTGGHLRTSCDRKTGGSVVTKVHYRSKTSERPEEESDTQGTTVPGVK